MKLHIIKLLFLTIGIVALWAVNSPVQATTIECDGGRYRQSCGNCANYRMCTGYNWPCDCCGVEYSQPPWNIAARCGSSSGGSCYRCVGGSYVDVSNTRACDMWNTPPCVVGANYSLCWANYYGYFGSQYLWSDQLGQSSNYLCATPSLSLNKSSMNIGQQVGVTWITNRRSTANWIGLYRTGSGDGSYVSWVYANSCTTSAGGSANGSGSCNLTISSTGSYEFRFFYAGGWSKLATSSQVSVINPTPTPTPTPSPTPTPTPLPAPQPTVVPPSSLPPGQCVSGNLMAISWVNNINPVTWVDIGVNSPTFASFYHKDVTSISKANQSASTFAPAGFFGCGSQCSNAIPGTQPMQFCPNQSYYVRLYNGVSTNGGHSIGSVVVLPIPTYTPTPTPTPRPWTKTSGGDMHVNR